MKMHPQKRLVFLAACVVLTWAFANMAIVRLCDIPPRDATRTTMWVLKCRILRYARQNGRLPKSLEEVPEIDHKSTSLDDWWGNPIGFDASADGIVTLSSAGGRVWGRDPRQGEPLVCHFPAKKAAGEWSDVLVELTED